MAPKYVKVGLFLAICVLGIAEDEGDKKPAAKPEKAPDPKKLNPDDAPHVNAEYEALMRKRAIDSLVIQRAAFTDNYIVNLADIKAELAVAMRSFPTQVGLARAFNTERFSMEEIEKLRADEARGFEKQINPHRFMLATTRCETRSTPGQHGPTPPPYIIPSSEFPDVAKSDVLKKMTLQFAYDDNETMAIVSTTPHDNPKLQRATPYTPPGPAASPAGDLKQFGVANGGNFSTNGGYLNALMVAPAANPQGEESIVGYNWAQYKQYIGPVTITGTAAATQQQKDAADKLMSGGVEAEVSKTIGKALWGSLNGRLFYDYGVGGVPTWDSSTTGMMVLGKKDAGPSLTAYFRASKDAEENTTQSAAIAADYNKSFAGYRVGVTGGLGKDSGTIAGAPYDTNSAKIGGRATTASGRLSADVTACYSFNAKGDLAVIPVCKMGLKLRKTTDVSISLENAHGFDVDFSELKSDIRIKENLGPDGMMCAGVKNLGDGRKEPYLFYISGGGTW